MKSLPILWAVALIALFSVLCSPAAARRLALRPLSPRELKNAIIEAGIEEGAEGSPNGRSIASALAGITGFALGVKNGIGGALLFDVITSEQAIAYLTDMIDNINSNTGNNNNNDLGTYQEVCFNSRSLNGDLRQLRNYDELDDDEQLDDDEGDFYDDEGDNEQVRQIDDFAYDEPLSSALTCLVVNRGQPIVRHRRSIEFGMDNSEFLAEKSTN